MNHNRNRFFSRKKSFFDLDTRTPTKRFLSDSNKINDAPHHENVGFNFLFLTIANNGPQIVYRLNLSKYSPDLNINPKTVDYGTNTQNTRTLHLNRSQQIILNLCSKPVLSEKNIIINRWRPLSPSHDQMRTHPSQNKVICQRIE